MKTQQIVKELSDYEPQERRKIIKQVEQRENNPPSIGRKTNPKAVKFVFKALELEERTLGGLAEQMKEEGYFKPRNDDSLQIGVIAKNNELFEIDGNLDDPDTTVGLTEEGRNYAHAFSTKDYLTPLDKTICLGLVPVGFIFDFLHYLNENRETGITRTEMIDKFSEIYGGSDKITHGRAIAYLKRLSLVQIEKDGREKTYYPNFPERWK